MCCNDAAGLGTAVAVADWAEDMAWLAAGTCFEVGAGKVGTDLLGCDGGTRYWLALRASLLA